MQLSSDLLDRQTPGSRNRHYFILYNKCQQWHSSGLYAQPTPYYSRLSVRLPSAPTQSFNWQQDGGHTPSQSTRMTPESNSSFEFLFLQIIVLSLSLLKHQDSRSSSVVFFCLPPRYMLFFGQIGPLGSLNKHPTAKSQQIRAANTLSRYQASQEWQW